MSASCTLHKRESTVCVRICVRACAFAKGMPLDDLEGCSDGFAVEVTPGAFCLHASANPWSGLSTHA